MPEPPGWSLVPLVLVRGTGFPVELLDVVGTPETVAAADRWRALRDRLADLRTHFLDTLFPKVVEAERAAGATRADFKRWYRLRRQVDRAQPAEPVLGHTPAAAEFVDSWNRLARDVAEAEARLTDTGQREGADAWRRLARIASTDRFREAVFLSSPHMHEALVRHVAKKQPERDERTSTQLYGYLQRFTTKNETTSFFGPIDHAVVRPTQREPLRLDLGTGGLRRRRTRVAHWAVRALATAAGATEEPPTAVDDPLEWLRERLDAPWLTELHATAEAFADAPVDEKVRLLTHAQTIFARVTGEAASRPGGLYADRSILFDEAHGDLTVDIGQSMVDDLAARLRPALDVCATYSLLVQDVLRARAREVAHRLGRGRPVPYVSFVRALLSHVTPAECRQDPHVTAYVEELLTPGDRVIRLDPGPSRRPIPEGTCVSPDLFFVCGGPEELARGEYELVIGEIHYGVQVWTHLLAFWPDVAGLEADLARRLPDDFAATVHQRKQGKAFPRELPGWAIEFAGRSTKPRDQVLRATELEVVPTDDGVALRADGRVLRLHPGDPRAAPNWVFGPPPVEAPEFRLGAHTPRIVVGGAVLQRETWHVDGSRFTTLRDAPQAYARVRDLADELGLPRQWFGKVAGTRKPFFVDLDSLPSVRHLLSLVDPARELRCTELLPGPEHWWLPAAGGGRRGAEWRTTWTYGVAA